MFNFFKNGDDAQVIKQKKKSLRGKNPATFIDKRAREIEQSNIIDSDLYTKYNVKRGLRNANGTGVIVGLTQISDVVGYSIDEDNNKIPRTGELYYRGINIEDIVRSCIDENRFGFEETTYLLLFGKLPTKKQLDDFCSLLGESRELPLGFARDMILTTPSNSIMNKLSRSVLALYCSDENPDDISISNVLRQCIQLISYFPSLIAYAYQAKLTFFENRSLHLRTPKAELSTAENILRMLRSDGHYTDLEAKLLDICLILHAEHGAGNNSSFTTHVISSTGTDTYAAISAAIGSLKGPKHGGANTAVTSMIKDMKANIRDITNEKAVKDYIAKIIRKEAGDRTGLVYGMGHAIYTLSDPRAKLLKIMAKRLAEHKDFVETFKLCDMIETFTPEIHAEITGIEKPMCANVDLYSGFVYSALGIPADIATPLFATARLSGWSAHRLEELTTGKKLMRPANVCVKPHQEYVPIANRT